jgi:hypothetical protein
VALGLAARFFSRARCEAGLLRGFWFLDRTRERLDAGSVTLRVVAVVLLAVFMAACQEAAQPDEPVVVHARQPKNLVGEWANDAIQAAWDTACLNESSVCGSLHGWSTTKITPPPNDARTVLPERMTGIAYCRDGSRHTVVVLFDAPAR